MPDNHDDIPQFLGPEDSFTTFVDNSTTINKSYASSSRSHSARFGRGGFGLLRSVFCILLVLVVFSYISTGRTDQWSFTRLLEVLQGAPNIAPGIIDNFKKGIDFLHIDYIAKTGIGAALINLLNHLTGSISIIGFLVAGLVQSWAFIYYFVSLLFV